MKLKITILIDNKNSWIIDYSQDLLDTISSTGHLCNLIHKHSEVIKGDVLILLSCNKIFKSLDLNMFNLVVHESNLPEGRGMSPFTWQILEGKSVIPVTLLEATKELDAGKIYGKINVKLNGSELIDEWREHQYNATKNLILSFLDNYPNIQGVSQSGVPTFYRSRNINDSKLNVSKSIEEQFNLFRISDNLRYPAWFEKNGYKYKLEIKKINE